MNERDKMLEDENVWREVIAEETRARDLLDRYLGLRPSMLVTGISVTQEQAMEIIRRTDRLFRDLTSNEYSYLVRISRKLHIPLWEDYQRKERGSQYEDDHQRWLRDWRYIETEYVRNDWISSQYLYGPHGWCHPDGTIGHIDNVGERQIGEEIPYSAL